MTSSDLAYPIGRWRAPDTLTEAQRRDAVGRITTLPDRLGAAVRGLDDRQLATPCRPGGWTVRQVVHHLADSHIHAYIRTKLAATALRPKVVAYDQEAWATLPDVASVPVSASLAILAGLHARWGALLAAFSDQDWVREYDHSENGIQRLDVVTHHYAWHGDHHLAQITALRAREGW
jgi:uncharacterized damage-inducible protein DinB